MKICGVCKLEKCDSEYWKRNSRKCGLHYCCKSCANKIRDERRSKDPEREKLVRKLWYEKNKKKQIAKQKVYNETKADKNKLIARRKLNDALKLGHIEKRIRCQCCNKKSRLEAHHADYSKPLDVIWVCKSCHIKIHKR